MAVRAVNEGVRAEEGADGTLVVLAAWCERCQTESMPLEDGGCSFCGRPIVDLDALKAKDLRAAIAGARVIPLRPEPEPEPALLRLAEGFALPIEVAGEAIAILAKRGAGKTNAARVLAEELFRAGVQIVVLDPVGVWWGLRSGADGRQEGLPIPILGGEHGDVELMPWGGAEAAALAVETGASYVVDLSEFPRDAQRLFVADFATELYTRKRSRQTLLHVLLEEADEFAPQSSRGGGPREETSRMRGSIEQLARRGRSRGIGITMITQRSAALSKDVLTQADVLLALRTTGPTDIRAIEAWVSHRGAEGGELVASLPSLKTGEGWFWNPERDLLARVQIRLARTFDSSSTPRFGETRTGPERVAPVALPLQLAEAVGGERDSGPDDYRRQDADGRWGCKTDGCPGRSSRRAGPYAYLCDDCGPGEPPPRPVEAEPQPDRPATAIASASEPADDALFGLTGEFARDAGRARAEAERLRRQADALELVAQGLDRLAELQAES